MRTTFLFSLLACIHLLCASTSFALDSVEIKVTRQKLSHEVDRKTDISERVSTKEILYRISVQSKTFKQLSNLEAKYMIFYYDSRPGSTAAPEEKAVKGTEKIIALAGNRLVEFNTKPITLTTVQLDGNWMWGNGASNLSRDRVSGVWVRVYAEDTLVGEYASPATITKRDWQE